jgi:Cupin-like domain
LTAIAEWREVDAARFKTEVCALYQPAVLRGIAADWPAVRRAVESPRAIDAYLRGFDSGKPVDTLLAPARAKGRIFYNDNLTGFNFTRHASPISAVSAQLLRYAAFDNRPMVAVQSALIADCLPGFTAQNRLEILDASIQPRIWLGNRVVTPAHFDESSNIACVVSGRRRFTLFPPDQVANLYIGPLDYAPTGTPISLVSFREPDFERFPRFREALAHAQVAELEPGDALYIPALWWHHVESLEKYNMLVNYWWKGAPDAPGKSDSALDCLVHALVNLRHLPPEQRAAWGTIFDHYVFDAAAQPAAHIPPHRRGVLGEMSPDFRQQVRAFLVKQLEREK